MALYAGHRVSNHAGVTMTLQGTVPGILGFVLLDKKPSKLGRKKLPERIIKVEKQPLRS